MMDRAYSLLEIKGVDEDARVITGVASTPITDRVGDIVEPGRPGRRLCLFGGVIAAAKLHSLCRLFR